MSDAFVADCSIGIGITQIASAGFTRRTFASSRQKVRRETRLIAISTNRAEACFLLVSSRLSKTTGLILPVNGGLPEAFLR